ncbi:MAG TPA: VOC family protein [Planctomycetaceae bacterium]|nr:VOC family protein [Planctomycetaceae bacterium]
MNQHRILGLALAVNLLVVTAVRAAEPAHFHHVRLNVRDVSKSMRFYQRLFGAVPIKYRGNSDSLFVERSFLLFNKVETAPETALNTAIWHIGWGGVDLRSEYEWYRKYGADIQTPLSPLPGADNYYFYQWGPDKELIEINTMGHHRFAHVHLFATDVNATCRWYREHLGLKPRLGERPKPKGDMATLDKIWLNFMQCDNVSLIVFGKPDVSPSPPWWPEPPLKSLQPTKGRPIDHLAFSYRNIEPVYEAMKQSGVKIAETPKTDPKYHFKSFFVEGPDGVLIEIVEEKPVPDGIWE